jgi:hypothetical protein
MHGPMNVKFPNNTSKWQIEFNSAFKGLMIAKHKISKVKFKLINFCSDVSHSQKLLLEDRGPGEVQVS